MLNQMPKFAQLITSNEPAEDRIAKALEDDPTSLIMKITPKDGIPFTEEEKDAIRAVITQFTDTARIEKVERLRKELIPEDAEKGDSEPPKEKARLCFFDKLRNFDFIAYRCSRSVLCIRFERLNALGFFRLIL